MKRENEVLLSENSRLQKENDSLRDQLKKQEQKMAQLKQSFADGLKDTPQVAEKRAQ